MKNITFTDKGWADFMGWSKTDRKIFTRTSNLIEETARTPFKGSGKPELLKHELSGYWSRRINHEHRLVYSVTENAIEIRSCKYHY
jgi:toxin YoeB